MAVTIVKWSLFTDPSLVLTNPTTANTNTNTNTNRRMKIAGIEEHARHLSTYVWQRILEEFHLRGVLLHLQSNKKKCSK